MTIFWIRGAPPTGVGGTSTFFVGRNLPKHIRLRFKMSYGGLPATYSSPHKESVGPSAQAGKGGKIDASAFFQEISLLE